ncbi:DgyrCDS13756 [Dimorphilus gyrociliatus]|uniref:DgyrCDS13756 n=1 Tax=Dimorphilus gyrociliatus TaxID=2664684 RepID=A0A7I8WBN1_9ANNE|nr:DgyrCDS13756 [Dimorphilus gyrociliatus]
MSSVKNVIMQSNLSPKKEDNSTVKKCLDYICKEKEKIYETPYGVTKKNCEETLDALKTESLKNSVKKIVDDSCKKVNASDEERLKSAFADFMALISRKLVCVQNIQGVANLENSVTDFMSKVDLSSRYLIDIRKQHETIGENVQVDRLNTFLPPNAHDCIHSVSDAWNWIQILMECVSIQLKHSSDYHQFFHEIQESGPYFNKDLEKLLECMECKNVSGDLAYAKELCDDMKKIVDDLKRWRIKSVNWLSKSLTIVPIDQRVKPIVEGRPIPGIILRKQAENTDLRENEDILIEKNEGNEWKIKNCKGESFLVPNCCVTIPTPCDDAVDAATYLQLRLLEAWTMAVKKVGKRVIVFLLAVLAPAYTGEEIEAMRKTNEIDKNRFVNCLDGAEDELSGIWKDYNYFVQLQERFLAAKMIMKGGEEISTEDGDSPTALVVQTQAIDNIIKVYKELVDGWKAYAMTVDASRRPKLMLVVDRWQHFKFVTSEYATKFWHANLDLTDEEKSIAGLNKRLSNHNSNQDNNANNNNYNSNNNNSNDNIVNKLHVANEESIQPVHEEMLSAEVATDVMTEGQMDEVESTDYAMGSEVRTAETEQLDSIEGEEQKTFIIRSVFDPDVNEQISLHDAIKKGVICPERGVYITKEGKDIPIPVAMSDGKIIVEFQKTRRAKEKKSTLGIITLKTIRERDAIIEQVKDVEANQFFNKQTAITSGLLNDQLGLFFNTKTGTELTINEAVKAGYIVLSKQEPEESVEAYAVRGVVDRKKVKVITFFEAVQKGIIDRDSGLFLDTSNGDKLYIADAIARGFLKARKVDDPNSLDVDPSNRMVIDKTNLIKKKLLGSLKVISAFKSGNH